MTKPSEICLRCVSIRSIVNITLQEVEKNWKKAQMKKLTDTVGLSVFLLRSKHAKDGLYPEINKLRPISCPSSIGKVFERIIHMRTLRWCNDKGIYIHE